MSEVQGTDENSCRRDSAGKRAPSIGKPWSTERGPSPTTRPAAAPNGVWGRERAVRRFLRRPTQPGRVAQQAGQAGTGLPWAAATEENRACFPLGMGGAGGDVIPVLGHFRRDSATRQWHLNHLRSHQWPASRCDVVQRHAQSTSLSRAFHVTTPSAAGQKSCHVSVVETPGRQGATRAQTRRR